MVGLIIRASIALVVVVIVVFFSERWIGSRKSAETEATGQVHERDPET